MGPAELAESSPAWNVVLLPWKSPESSLGEGCLSGDVCLPVGCRIGQDSPIHVDLS